MVSECAYHARNSGTESQSVHRVRDKVKNVNGEFVLQQVKQVEARISANHYTCCFETVIIICWSKLFVHTKYRSGSKVGSLLF